MKRQILAMGGGGFLMEPENPRLDSFFFSLAGKTRPKVCFVGTASGDTESVYQRFDDNMKNHNVEPSHLSLFKPPPGSLEDFVLEKDVIYICGGNTRNLMVLWREWGLDKILRKAYERGVVMGGVSAGSLCWFEQGVTDSITGRLSPISCLGWLAGSNCVHYDEEVERRPSYQKLVADGMKPGLACSDGVAGYFVNEKLVEFVTSRPGQKAYRVEMKDGKVLETALEARLLPEKKS